jgi:methyl-accepting chemotaxis protein
VAVVRELISLPFNAARAAIELPRSMQRSINEANELMEVSREQLEVMRRQADQALEQAERMNELLGRVVKLTEPLERAQRGGEFVAGELKKAIFGAEQAVIEAEEATAEARKSIEKAEEAADVETER